MLIRVYQHVAKMYVGIYACVLRIHKYVYVQVCLEFSY